MAWNFIETMLANTQLGHAAIKKELKNRIELHFATGKEQLAELKKTISKGQRFSKEFIKTLNDVEKKTEELKDFIKAEAQLKVFASVIGEKRGDYSSTEELLDALKATEAVKEMKGLITKLVSPEIYKGVTDIIEQAGDIKGLKLKQQRNLVKTLKGDEIANQLEAIDLEEALIAFKESSKKLCEELAIDEDNRLGIEAVLDDLQTEYLSSFEEIKNKLQAHLPEILAETLKHVYEECPHLAIIDAPKPITHARAAAASRGESKAEPKKKLAPKKSAANQESETDESDVEVAVLEPVKKKAPPRKGVTTTAPEKKAAPKRKEPATSDANDASVVKKKGPGRR